MQPDTEHESLRAGWRVSTVAVRVGTVEVVVVVGGSMVKLVAMTLGQHG